MAASSASDDDRHPRPVVSRRGRSNSRADVTSLHEALHSPSPLGGILDGLHRSQTGSDGSGGNDGGGDGDDERGRCPLSPDPTPGNGGGPSAYHLRSDRSLLSVSGTGSVAGSVAGAGASLSVASSAVVTVVTAGVHNAVAHWKVLCFGQLVSFFLAAAGAASEELNGQCRVSVPLTQTALAGGVLAMWGAHRMGGGWCAGCRGRSRVRRRDGGDGRSDEDEDEEEERFCGGGSDREDVGGGDSDFSSKPLRSPLTAADESERAADGGWASDRDDDDGDGPSRPAPSPAAKSRRRPSRSRPRSFCWGLRIVRAPIPLYLLSSFVAVQGRYLLFLAFRYTSLVFVYAIDALAIPSAMAFGRCLLRRRYRATHVVGGMICVAGVLVSTVSDLTREEDDYGGGAEEEMGGREDVGLSGHLKGDVIAIAGAVLLGLDDVISELLIKNYGGEDELLFMKWFFGAGISVVQLVLLERDGLDALLENRGDEPCDRTTRFTLLAVYVAFQVLDIAGELRFLSISEAALLNLSLLTADLWAAAFSIVAVGLEPSALYYASLSLIFLGIVLYEAGPSPMSRSTPSDIRITIAATADASNNGKSMGGHVEMKTNGLI